jgi:hypothetical protein
MPHGAGGTSGGFLEFFVGLAMVIVGGFLFFQRLMVSSSLRVLWGGGGSGLALLVLLAGIGLLFFSGRSRIGWLLIVLGIVGIVISIFGNLVVYFMPTSLFQSLITFILLIGGLALIIRSLRPHGSST